MDQKPQMGEIVLPITRSEILESGRDTAWTILSEIVGMMPWYFMLIFGVWALRSRWFWGYLLRRAGFAVVRSIDS